MNPTPSIAPIHPGEILAEEYLAPLGAPEGTAPAALSLSSPTAAATPSMKPSRTSRDPSTSYGPAR